MDELPAELLGYIITAIDEPKPPYRRFRTLASLCLVNRNLNRIATPLLYKNIARAATCHWRVGKNSLFYQCLKTLRSQPGLRAFVKQIQDVAIERGASGYLDALENERAIVQSDDTDPVALMAALAEELDLPVVERVLARYAYGEDIWPALCCLLAPNLERVHILVRDAIPGTPLVPLLLEYICHSALGTPLGKVHSFEKLRFLHVDAGYPPRFPVTYAYPLLLLPRLETLILGDWGALYDDQSTLDVDDSTIFDVSFTWPQRQSSIRNLSIRRPLTTVGSASKLIRACEKLVKFESTCIAWVEEEYRYDHLSSALQEHSTTLREISIWEGFSPILMSSLYGSLQSQHMTCLARLRAPLPLLIGYKTNDDTTLPDRLPRSLEELTIEYGTIPDVDVEVYFKQLHEQCAAGRFPALRHIHLLWRLFSTPYPFPFDIEAMQDLYARCQIRFDMTAHCSEATCELTKNFTQRFMLADSDLAPDHTRLCQYGDLFPAYARYKFHSILGEYVPQGHFVKASTSWRSEEEHEILMTGIPPCY